MKTAKVLTENDLTPLNLRRFFQSEYMNAYVFEDERVYVHVDDGLLVQISLDKTNKLLKFFVAYDNDTFQLGIANINVINLTNILGRFAVYEHRDIIIVTYHLPYEGGITPYQLLAVLRTLATVANDAIDEEASRVQEEPPDSIKSKKVLN